MTSNMKWSHCYARGRGGYRSVKRMQHKIGEIHAADIEKGEIMCEELNEIYVVQKNCKTNMVP